MLSQPNLIGDGKKPGVYKVRVGQVGMGKITTTTVNGVFVLTGEAAKILKCSTRRVRALISDGVLHGERAGVGGRDWLVSMASLTAYQKTPRKPGRPPNQKGKFG